jgi:hypothetical protein
VMPAFGGGQGLGEHFFFHIGVTQHMSAHERRLHGKHGHTQGDGTRPTAAEQQEIVNFEMGLSALACWTPFSLLHAYIATGKKDEALAFLQKGYSERIPPYLRPLKSNRL